ncbi:hypothetical protein [Pseudomonas viridiflava]|uniref:hypothetical protein n=1 Tax=Pseudomonas viridiflava TaxID=33069 RepID=UPI002ECAD12C|nr:hypothetical protein [Pseudomonas viridiflava]
MTDEYAIELKAILPNGDEAPAERMGQRYYGTRNIDPERAFEHGIPIKGSDRRLLEHLKDGYNSAFRGTTVLSNVNPAMGQGAALWADEGGWVYNIGPMMGWDPSALLEEQIKHLQMYRDSPTAIECEITVPARIEPNLIYRAGRVEARGQLLLVRKWTYNPAYRSNR